MTAAKTHDPAASRPTPSQGLAGRVVKMTLPLEGIPDADAALRHRASAFPAVTREQAKAGENERIVVECSLKQAGGLRDELFDIWAGVWTRPGAGLRLDGETISLAALKRVFAVLDCAESHAAQGTIKVGCQPSRGGWNWGCLHLHDIAPEYDLAGKPRMAELKNALAQAIEERRLGLCPYFRFPEVEKAVAAFAAIPSASQKEPRMDPKFPRDERTAQTMPQGGSAAGAGIAPATYAEIGGLDDAVRVVRECIELPLKHPEALVRLGVPPHRGALLYGPPGCGKTLLAKAVAHESNAAFLAVSGPELITKWHGESEEKLRELFAEAIRRQPSIVFFDEIDAIAQSRSADESLRLDTRFTTQLLTLLDGIHDPGRVFVLAATNRIDMLDTALLRPGRLDRIIEIPLPDHEGLVKILGIHTRTVPLAKTVNVQVLAARLAGCTGADVAFLVREAAYAALRRTFDLEAILREAGPLPADRLQRLRVTASDFTGALKAMRQRHKSAGTSPVATRPPRATRHAE
ncbi:MAG: AAA family ATPase [Desulfovibrionaceae bacterium]|nr:AAA family ATPase [Desulfovibrionaceae bacterium]